MNFDKDDKGFVKWWIDRQFATNATFPAQCCGKVKGKQSVSRDHVLAYREWGKVPFKRRKMLEWIDDWLSRDEQDALKEAIRNQHRYDMDD